jgi:hypothetical protein
MQTVIIKGSYRYLPRGVVADFRVFAFYGKHEIEVANCSGVADLADAKHVLPERLQDGHKSYEEDYVGFLRDDGSIFVLMNKGGNEGLEPQPLRKVIDLGLKDYSEGWLSYSVPSDADFLSELDDQAA